LLKRKILGFLEHKIPDSGAFTLEASSFILKESLKSSPVEPPKLRTTVE
jgi:hypothetical protein